MIDANERFEDAADNSLQQLEVNWQALTDLLDALGN